jgi:hypothetical protein
MQIIVWDFFDGLEKIKEEFVGSTVKDIELIPLKKNSH